MEIKVGDYVRWTGEKLDSACRVDGIYMDHNKLPFTDGTPRKVLAVEVPNGGFYIWLELEGIDGIEEGLLSYPLTMLEVVSQEQELPQYGERVLVWDDDDEDSAEERIYIGYLKGAISPVIVVADFHEEEFANGDAFTAISWEHFKRIPKPQYRPCQTKEEAMRFMGKITTKNKEPMSRLVISVTDEYINGHSFSYMFENYTCEGKPVGVEI